MSKRRHVPYHITYTGAHWEAHHIETGRLQGRSYVSAEHLRSHMDTVTESV